MRRHSHTGACDSRQTGHMVGLAYGHTINAPGGLPMSVTPRRGTPLAPCRQVGVYQCVVGGCAPSYVVAVDASGRRSSFLYWGYNCRLRM